MVKATYAKATYWAKAIALWALQILLGLAFLWVGATKFLSAGWVERFASWGYSESFLYLIGAFEVLGGIGLLIPKTASYAASGLIVVMIGATITHLVHGEMNYTFTLIIIALLSIVLYARRPAFLRRQPRAMESGS